MIKRKSDSLFFLTYINIPSPVLVYSVQLTAMRKASIVITFLLFTTFSLFAQTNVTIIGTKHDGNQHFDHKTIYKYLQDIKPDVILIEQDDQYKKSNSVDHC